MVLKNQPAEFKTLRADSYVVRDYSVKITVWRMSWELAAADMT